MIITRWKLQPEQITSLVALVAFMLLGGIFSIFFGQDNNWDMRNYHIYNAYSFLFDRSHLDILPAQFQSFFNPLPDLFLLFLIVNFQPMVVGFIMGAIHGINYFLIFKIAHIALSDNPDHQLSYKQYSVSITPSRMALLLSLTAFTAPVSFSLLGTCYHDNLVSIPLLFSLWLILISLKNPHQAVLRLMLWAGFAGGISFGLKMTSAIFILGSGLTLFVVVPKLYAKLKALSMYSAGFIGGMLLSSGFWYLELWQKYASPVFPWFNTIFKSPEVLDVSIRDTRYLPASILDGLLYPFYFMYRSPYSISHWSFRDIRFAIIMVLLIIFVSVWLKNKLIDKERLQVSSSSVFILIFFIFSYIIWLVQFSIYRYLFILEQLAFVGIAILIYNLIRSSKVGSGIIIGLVLITFYTGWSPRPDRLPWQEHYINAQIPDLEGLDSSVVILGGNRPTSFLIPGFPETTRVIRLQSNMHTYLSPESEFISQTRHLMRTHAGNFYILTLRKYLTIEQELMDRFDLEIDTGISWMIRNPHEPKLQIWKVNRK